MTLDTRLRDTLTTRSATVTPPPAPLANLTSGVRRRRANRARVVGAASAAVAIAVGVPMLRPAPHPVNPAGRAVAWLDQPFVLGDEPSYLPNLHPARECTATDLAVTVRAEGQRYVIEARNTGSETCTLISRPTLEAQGAPVPTSEAPESVSFRRVPFVTLRPGTSREAWVEVPRNCDDPRTVRYTQVSAVVYGATAPLAGVLGAACGLTVTKFLGDPESPTAGPGRIGDVAVAGIAAPAVVRAGSTFTFQVSLIADTAGAFIYGCPLYVMSLGPVVQAYFLNCVNQTMSGGERRRFEMRLTVPAGTPPGRYPLVWWILSQTDPAPTSVLGTVTVE